MRICPEHWSALRNAIEQRGLSSFVARDAREAFDSLVRQLEDKAGPVADFDPLMGAHWAIVGQFTKDIGLAAFVGDLCPLCEVDKSATGRADNWINGASDDQLAYARNLGLVPSADGPRAGEGAA